MAANKMFAPRAVENPFGDDYEQFKESASVFWLDKS
jgi:hypothetical protein